MQNIDKKYICPECGKALVFMAAYTEKNKVISLWSCETCKDGTDRDWEVTYDREKGFEKIKRHFWG